ncbi:MAG: hypothetical protein IH869_06595, partial [Chloroflexi bacterium]|nr:hypothetical protein [Chloroflexota bacterium]
MTYTPLAPTTTGDDGSVLPAPAAMQIRKRNGGLETADVMKIVRAVERSSGGLGDVDP